MIKSVYANVCIISPYATSVTRKGGMEPGGQGRLIDLYADAQTDLKRYLRSKLPNKDDLEDVAQECYLRVQRSEKFVTGNVENPRAFLFRVAANLLTDRARQQYRRDRDQNLMGRPIYVSDAEDAPSAQPTPDTCVEAEEELDCVLKAIKKLPPKCQRALILQRFEGFSHKQIAQTMHVSKSMVEKYIARAMVQLYKALP
jgi:RNA polymerase sigma-70 factor (ECF subfamily)